MEWNCLLRSLNTGQVSPLKQYFSIRTKPNTFNYTLNFMSEIGQVAR